MRTTTTTTTTRYVMVAKQVDKIGTACSEPAESRSRCPSIGICLTFDLACTWLDGSFPPANCRLSSQCAQVGLFCSAPCLALRSVPSADSLLYVYTRSQFYKRNVPGICYPTLPIVVFSPKQGTKTATYVVAPKVSHQYALI